MPESNIKTFNHLKIHKEYSICEGAIKIEDLEKFCKNNKINSLGISDTSNLCGVLQFSETVSKSKTQPIIGSQIKFKYKDLLGGKYVELNNVPSKQMDYLIANNLIELGE